MWPRKFCGFCGAATAAPLGLLQIPDRGVQGVIGYAAASQAKRYQKMNDPVPQVIAHHVEGALWGTTATRTAVDGQAERPEWTPLGAFSLFN